MSSLNVAIVGAGPAGLTFARILSKQSPSFSITVFERDRCPEARSQRGTFYLLGEDAQNAMKQAGLWDSFQNFVRYPGDDIVVADKTGKIHIQFEGVNFGRPEIDRTSLRHFLLDSLPTSMIKWNANVKQALLDPSTGKSTLHFADGTSTGYIDLLVGADGAWSKIRQQIITPLSPFYSGFGGFEAHIHPVVAKKYCGLENIIGKRNYLAFGEAEGNCLLCQRIHDGSICVYVFGKRPERWLDAYGDAADYRKSLLADYMEWSSEQRSLIELCDDNFLPRSLFMLPVGLRWPSRRGVTLLGDAAHLMTPFAGEGINLALQDAKMLAAAVQKSPEDMAVAVAEFEAWMFPNAREASQRTWDDLQDYFEEGGCLKYRQRLEAHMQQAVQNRQCDIAQ